MAVKTRRPGADVRRREITDAAIEVFGEKNYSWATTREIAERAGVSERTLFFYFKNKKELYKTAFRKCGQELIEAVNRGNPPLDDIRTFIKMGSRNVVAFLKENPLKMKMIIQSVADEIGIKPGETTPDGRFSFELTNCIGACDKAPAMLINSDVHGNLTAEKISQILKSYK